MELLLPLLAYLSGSLLFGELLARLKGVDLRRVGSGNVGATNVSRVLGKKAGALVFLLDALKGFIPVKLALHLCGLGWCTALSALFAVLGHMYPLFFRFKGGKGVATAFGVLFALYPSVALLTALFWLAVVLKTRTVSLASLSSSLFALLLIALKEPPPSLFASFILVTLLIFYRHRDNVLRLLEGKEHKV